MPRRQSNTSPFAKPTSASSASKPPPKASDARELTFFDVPDVDDEDPTLRQMQERYEKAAMVLQRTWMRRPRWNSAFAMDNIVEELAAQPQTGHEVSRAERQRLKGMGMRVPPSLGYCDTPIAQFLDLLAVVASLSEQARSVNNPPSSDGSGSVRGRLSGTFYELGAGTGLLCFAAALFHDFDTIVGYEILPGLFDLCEVLHEHYKYRVRGRLLRRADRDFPNVKFVVGDALALKWSSTGAPPSMVYCHSSLFDDELMMRLSERLAVLPNDTFIVTTTSPVPPSTSLNGKELVSYAVLERFVMMMPWGPMTAFIQQRKMSELEEHEYHYEY